MPAFAPFNGDGDANSHFASVNGVADLHIEQHHISAADALSGNEKHLDTMLLICTYTDNEILAHIPRGEHGEGIYAWTLNGTTGQLGARPTSVSRVTPNPAFLLKHPTLDVVYASTECIHAERCGEVVTLGLGSDGLLAEKGRVSAGGRSTCYLTMHAGFLTAVNYWDSIVALLPVSATDGLLGLQVDAHMQPGAEYVFETNPDRVEHWAHRQRWPHTHCFVTAPAYGAGPASHPLHLVPDLGQDTVWCFAIDPAAQRLVLRGGARLAPQQGPRHLVFHPTQRTCYVINELKSTVSVLHYLPENLGAGVAEADPTADGAGVRSAVDDPSCFLQHAQTLRTLPDDFESNDHHKSHASEIRVHPNGKFVLVANRGHDSIACFAVDDTAAGRGSLRLVHITPSGGAFPRNFNFDASGRFVVVGNQNSNTLCVFSFDAAGGMRLVDTKPQPSPNFVFALPATPHARPPY
jgi:6-phosphogluconolactonase (cycloisomerase 2 family)